MGGYLIDKLVRVSQVNVVRGECMQMHAHYIYVSGPMQIGSFQFVRVRRG